MSPSGRSSLDDKLTWGVSSKYPDDGFPSMPSCFSYKIPSCSVAPICPLNHVNGLNRAPSSDVHHGKSARTQP